MDDVVDDDNRCSSSMWQCVEAHEEGWQRVMIPPRILVAREWSNEDDFSQASRSERVLSNGATYGLIGEAEVVVAARQ